MAVDQEEEKLDDKTIGCLEDAKKGKPRRFALVSKGAKIVSLVVYKKGSLDKYKKQAKEQGQGQFFHGVVDGKGANLNFKLARADGFEKAPGPTQGLKQFLTEKAGLKVSPIYEIVDEIGPVLDTDDPLTARFVKLQNAALAACDAHPDRAEEINSLCGEIGKLLDRDEASDAKGKIESLEGLLKQLGGPAAPVKVAAAKPAAAPAPTPPTDVSPAPPPSEVPPVPPPPAPPADRLPEFMNKLKQLKPELDQVKAAAATLSPDGQAKAAEAAALAKQAGGLAQKKDFDQAFDLLEQATALISEALRGGASAPASDSESEDMENQCTALRKAVFPQIKPAVVAAPAVKDELVSLLNAAAADEKSRAFPAAIAKYQQLQAKVTAALAGGAAKTQTPTGGIGGVSVMKLGKARIEWRNTREAAIKSMDVLKVKLAEGYESQPEMQSEVAGALKRLDEVFVKLNEVLYEQLDDVLNESDPGKRADLANVAKKTMADFMKYVDGDRVMRALDNNEFAPNTQITAPLRAKLQEIAAALG